MHCTHLHRSLYSQDDAQRLKNDRRVRIDINVCHGCKTWYPSKMPALELRDFWRELQLALTCGADRRQVYYVWTISLIIYVRQCAFSCFDDSVYTVDI